MINQLQILLQVCKSFFQGRDLVFYTTNFFSLFFLVNIYSLFFFYIGKTGETTTVTCSAGYSGGGTAKCGTDQKFNTLTCDASPCTAVNVANSNKANVESITGTTGETVAVLCNAGYYGTGATVCQTDGKFSVTVCTRCGAGRYNENAGQTGQTSCKNNCGAGSYITSDQTACSVCIKGRWQDKQNQPNCNQCNAGKFSDQEERASDTCQECSTGTYAPATGSAVCLDDCDAGSYISENKISCDVCPVGRWQNQSDQTSCKKCIKGKVLRFTGKTSDVCEECIIGLYNPYEGHTGDCLPCVTANVGGSSKCAGW